MSKSNYKYTSNHRPIKLHHFYTTSAYAQARENHCCSYTQIMDVEEDSDLSFLSTSSLVKNVWVYIGAFYIYVLTCRDFLFLNRESLVLIRATHHVINHSNTIELQTSASHVCLYCLRRALGIGLKTGFTVVDIKMGTDVRKPDFGAWEQQRRRPVFVSMQSDQRLYCSLIGNNILTCLMQKFHFN